MSRRVFGRHEYERRRLFNWPIYSPKVKKRSYVARHERHPLFGVRKPLPGEGRGWMWWR